MPNRTYVAVLNRAREIAGSTSSLAAMLGVPEAALAEWLSGSKAPPNEVFLAALDIVSGGQPGARSSGPPCRCNQGNGEDGNSASSRKAP